MRALSTLVIPLLLITAACDSQGTPQQETKELVQAVKDGDNPGSVAEEAGEVLGAAGREVSEAMDDAGDNLEKSIEDARKKKKAE